LVVVVVEIIMGCFTFYLKCTSFCSIFWIPKFRRSRYHPNWSSYPKKFSCPCLVYFINLLERYCVFFVLLAIYHELHFWLILWCMSQAVANH